MLKNLLTKEILLVLGIKLAILYGLWALCFSHPIDKQLSAADVTSHIFNSNSSGKSL